MLKRFVFSALAALTLAVGATGALAAGGGSGGPATFPVEWTINSPPCSDLPPGTTIEGIGTIKFREHVTVTPSGDFEVRIIELARGTAVDGEGGTYRWGYGNFFKAVATEFPFTAHITDFFFLTNDETGEKLRTFFNLDVLVTGPGEEDVIFLGGHVRGDPEFCDPI